MTNPVKITLPAVKQRATPKSYARGLQYYQDEAIFDAAKRGAVLEGYCQGSEFDPYRVVVTFNETGIQSATCTCEYNYEGDCKHIVALLLTYVNNADLFPERPPLDQVLENRSKPELISLIQQMVSRYPDLEKLLDRPVPTPGKAASPVNTESMRREIRRAMKSYDGWGDHTAEGAVYSAAETAQKFAENGDWRNASAIYCAILEECHSSEYVEYDEGEFASAIGTVADALGECLEQPDLVNDDAERRKILWQLLEIELWDVELGGYEIAGDAWECILAHATPADVVEIRPRIQKAQATRRKQAYGQWGMEALERLLIQLDTIASTDPEETLKRLRDQQMYQLLVEKLLVLQRLEEAIAVVKEHLTHPHERLQAGAALAGAGYTTPAIELVQETLRQNFDQQVVIWLLDQYHRSGDQAAYLDLQHKRMLASPQESYYQELKTAAQALDRWETMRPELMAWLEKQQHYFVLTKIHLQEQEWEAAWQALEKTKTQTWGEILDLEVATKTRTVYPQKALPIFIKHARQAIDRRNRDHYRMAAEYLVIVKELYEQIEDEAAWESLIKQIRTDFKRLPALQDELNQAGLYSH